MGRDKALLPFKGFDTLTEFQLSKLSSNFKNLYVSSKDKKKFDFKANFIEDLKEYQDSSPYIALISSFKTLDDDVVAFLSVDVPFFKGEHFETLYANLDNHQAVVAKSPNGKQPLCAIYKREVLQHLIALTNKKKYRFDYLFERIDVKFVEFEDEEIFVNLNTPDEYKSWAV